MPKSIDKSWFEMKDLRKRNLSNSVWIPLRSSERIEKIGRFGFAGYIEEFFGLGSLAIPLEHREQAKKLGWESLGLIHNQSVWASEGHYKPVDVYQYNDKINIGVELVLVQFIPNRVPEWHLHQDLVFAFNLLRENDLWLSPNDGYVEVVRLRRNHEGKPTTLEIKNEYLRDYLCARDMFLRVSWYRSRDAVVNNTSEIGSPTPVDEQTEMERFTVHVTPIIEGGHIGDGSFAVFHAARNDVDPEDDVPLPGPETPENVTVTTHKGKHEGRRLFRVDGEVWRNEEIDPAPNSPRVRGDRIPTGLHYIVDASGATQTSEELDNEDIMRWIWFRPEVIPALLKYRGSGLTWHTMETGSVGCAHDERVHFGINSLGLVTVYAYDVAKLPLWQQRVWVGYNIAPEGGVSKELLSAQVEATAAESSSPEQDFPKILETLDSCFLEEIGTPLFRPHSSLENISNNINRFRSLDTNGLFALAKDIIRIVADRIDTSALHKVAPPPKNEKWGSLKSLEKYLATIVSPDDAHTLMGPLVGTYELRLADAHLPKEELTKAYELTRIDPKAPPVLQGFRLIAAVASTLINMIRIIQRKIEIDRRNEAKDSIHC